MTTKETAVAIPCPSAEETHEVDAESGAHPNTLPSPETPSNVVALPESDDRINDDAPPITGSERHQQNLEIAPLTENSQMTGQGLTQDREYDGKTPTNKEEGKMELLILGGLIGTIAAVDFGLGLRNVLRKDFETIKRKGRWSDGEQVRCKTCSWKGPLKAYRREFRCPRCGDPKKPEGYIDVAEGTILGAVRDQIGK